MRLTARLAAAPFLALAIVTAQLAACSSASVAQQRQAQGFSFQQQGPIMLDVAEIEVVDDYTAPMKEPNVEHLIPMSPADAVRLWAADRLKADGTVGRARVVIRDAAVKEVPLQRTEGVRGWFTKDQSERYEGTLSVEVQVEGPGGYTGFTSVAVARSTTVPEDVSLAEREKAMLALVQSMAADLDAQLDAAIKSNLFRAVKF